MATPNDRLHASACERVSRSTQLRYFPGLRLQPQSRDPGAPNRPENAPWPIRSANHHQRRLGLSYGKTPNSCAQKDGLTYSLRACGREPHPFTACGRDVLAVSMRVVAGGRRIDTQKPHPVFRDGVFLKMNAILSPFQASQDLTRASMAGRLGCKAMYLAYRLVV